MLLEDGRRREPRRRHRAARSTSTRIRPDLAEVVERHALGLDERRPDAVARRRKTGQRTARENVDDLCDPGSFVEYGPLAIAAQRRRRTLEDLIARTPADGLVAGIGRVNGDAVRRRPRALRRARRTTTPCSPARRASRTTARRTACSSSPSACACRWCSSPRAAAAAPATPTAPASPASTARRSTSSARSRGLVPLVGINSGRCFAGNAALLGCCDVVIATANSNIGMGGPAMIEGGGLGVFRPEEVGPMDVQVPNGVVDVAGRRRGRGGARRQAVPRRTSRARCARWRVRRSSACCAR